MKYTSSLFLALLTFVISGCAEHTLDCSLVKSGKSIRIPINPNANSTTRNVRYIEQEGIEYLAVENMTSATISIYNLADCTHYKDVKPQVQGPNGLGDRMDGFDLINLDTIIVTFRGGCGDQLAIIDSEANIIKKLKFDISYDPYFSLPASIKSNLGDAVSFRDNILFLSNFCRDDDDAFYNMHTQSVGYCYDFINDKTFSDTLHLPDISKETSDILNSSFSMISNGEQRIVVFDGHSIYVYDDGAWKRYDTHSRLMSKALRAVKPSTIENVKIQFVENPHYRAMIYDKYRDVYYRIVYLGYDFKQGEDQFKLSDFLPRFSVMILDSDFNVIGETMMPEKMYNIHMFFVNKDGLWFSTNNIDNPNFEEDAINFDLFELKR